MPPLRSAEEDCTVKSPCAGSVKAGSGIAAKEPTAFGKAQFTQTEAPLALISGAPSAVSFGAVSP